MFRTIFTLGTIITGIAVSLFWGFSGEKEFDTKSIFTTDEIVWLGLDFTKAHFVGNFDQGFGVEPATGEELRDKWIPAWNNLIPAEQENFNLKRTFRKRYVYYDLAPVTEQNAQLTAKDLLNFNESRLSKETVQEMVKKYAPGERKEGIGIVFIIENFNKNSETASMYITFIDIATKKVLLCEYAAGQPAGFGLRNYWAGAIKGVLTQTALFGYNKWKKKYCCDTPA